MDITRPTPPPTLGATWLAQAHDHPWTALGLAASMLTVASLLATSLWQVATGEADATLRLALVGGLAGFAATILGALPALFLHHIAQRTEDVMLGFAAGMMLAASTFSLILPGIAAGEETPATGP